MKNALKLTHLAPRHPTDAAFSYICVRDHFSSPILPKKAESVFTTTGFADWKKAIAKDGFHSHDISQADKEATLHALKIPTEYSNVAASISEQVILKYPTTHNHP